MNQNKLNSVFLIRAIYIFVFSGIGYFLYVTFFTSAQTDLPLKVALPLMLNGSDAQGDDGDTGSEPTLVPTQLPSPTPSENSTLPTRTPAPVESDPTLMPEPILEPENTPTSMPAPIPVVNPNPIVFEAPQILEAVQLGDQAVVSWIGCEQASSFRLLYGRLDSRPDELETLTRKVEIGPLAAGTYRLLLECYDQKGHSAFSPPVIMEVFP